MKKILNIFIVMIAIGFTIAGLYVFGLPPFQNSTPLYPAAASLTQEVAKPLPDFLAEDKITRNKTYAEHIARGALLESNKFYSLAIAEYQQANNLDPNNAEPFIKIGRASLLTNNHLKAEENFQKAVALQPENIDTQIYLGRTYLQERKITEARDLFNKISTETNQTIVYYKGILAAYFSDYPTAKNLLTKAVDMEGSTDITKKAQNYLGALSEFDFNQSGATQHLKTLLGRSYAQTGEYQMAIPILFEAIKVEKDYRDAWIFLGYSYLNTEKYQDAVEALEKAKTLDPKKPETFFYLGLAYDGQNNLEKAATNLEQAKNLGFQPVIQVDQKLAEIYLQLKQYQKSAQHYENVVALNDTNINYYIRPMWLYIEKTNEPQKALALAQKAFASHPNQPMSYNLIGWAQVQTNQLDEAQKNLDAALKLDPKLDAAYLNYGALWEKRNEPGKALTAYSKANKLGSGNPIGAAAAEKYNTLTAKVSSNPNAGMARLLTP